MVKHTNKTLSSHNSALTQFFSYLPDHFLFPVMCFSFSACPIWPGILFSAHCSSHWYLLPLRDFSQQPYGSTDHLTTCHWFPNWYLWPRSHSLWAFKSHNQPSSDLISWKSQASFKCNISKTDLPSSCNLRHPLKAPLKKTDLHLHTEAALHSVASAPISGITHSHSSSKPGSQSWCYFFNLTS